MTLLRCSRAPLIFFLLLLPRDVDVCNHNFGFVYFSFQLTHFSKYFEISMIYVYIFRIDVLSHE